VSYAADNESESRAGVGYTVNCAGRTGQAKMEANVYIKDSRLIPTKPNNII
jgi:hypothetical protein